MKILDRAFCIFPITLGRVDPQHLFDNQKITLGLSNFFPKNSRGFWKKIEKTEGGQIDSPLGISRARALNPHTEYVVWKHKTFSLRPMFPLIFPGTARKKISVCSFYEFWLKFGRSNFFLHIEISKRRTTTFVYVQAEWSDNFLVIGYV